MIDEFYNKEESRGPMRILFKYSKARSRSRYYGQKLRNAGLTIQRFSERISRAESWFDYI